MFNNALKHEIELKTHSFFFKNFKLFLVSFRGFLGEIFFKNFKLVFNDLGETFFKVFTKSNKINLKFWKKSYLQKPHKWSQNHLKSIKNVWKKITPEVIQNQFKTKKDPHRPQKLNFPSEKISFFQHKIRYLRPHLKKLIINLTHHQNPRFRVLMLR